MYESEANQITPSDADIPPEILLHFAESRESVTDRTVIPWSEHCTECVWPTCYTTCDLYSPRPDGRCRRFVDGMVRVNCPAALNSYLLKIRFKRWAKLWSPASLALHPTADADRLERRDLRIARLIAGSPARLRRTLTQKRYSVKKRWARHGMRSGRRPNCFLVECYNPDQTAIPISITIRRDGVLIPFQTLVRMHPGFNRHRVPVTDIERVFDLSASPFHVELTPNEVSEGATLYFGAMDFVLDQAFEAALATPRLRAEAARICKCVVWDLDNTVWDGTLIEDGPDKLRLKPGMVEILRSLDERGVLQSVASKNNPEEAMAALRRFGIDEYFLFPQISWEPKSRALQSIAASLNIGIDSFLFVDDSAFERAEVSSVLPDVTVVDAMEYANLLRRPECQLPVTEEGRKRRLFYRDQQRREDARTDYAGDYARFLIECQLRLALRPMREENLERVHELTQRTNQMNFSGNRYTREQLRELLARPDIDTYVL
ncbi:MAG TPA: HAD-IIIC family phosphatase, partial [Bryobacteraceae bacterium]|nr:HAD-IIIC family phosphatase [Bryobacteraceae bacterium]